MESGLSLTSPTAFIAEDGRLHQLRGRPSVNRTLSRAPIGGL